MAKIYHTFWRTKYTGHKYVDGKRVPIKGDKFGKYDPGKLSRTLRREEHDESIFVIDTEVRRIRYSCDRDKFIEIADEIKE